MSRSWLTRAESEADIATIREITGAAFSTPEEVGILDALRSDPAWIEGQSVVSTDASDVVVVGDPRYYSRFGFTRASDFGIALAYEVPDDAVMAMTLDPLDPLPSGVVRFADGFGM